MTNLKTIWRILLVMKDALALLFLLIFFAFLYLLLSSGPNPGRVRDGALMLSFNGIVVEQPAAIDVVESLTSGRAPMRELRQRDIVRALDLAIDDRRIKSVVLDLDRFLGGGQTSLADIGKALDRVKKSGKQVYAFATVLTDDGYQLAAHASEIWMDPLGGPMLRGPGGSRLYYKRLLDQLGVKAHIYRVGTYKSAVEPYARAEQSPEAKQAAKALNDEMWESWRSEVAHARPRAKLDALLADPAQMVEAAKGDLSHLALDNGLVDKLGDRVAFGKYIATKMGEDEDGAIGKFAATSAVQLLAANPRKENGEPIGVITAQGTIVDGKAGPGTVAGDTVAALIYDALKDEELKALVMRVDSPGGSVTASEKIRLALLEAKKRKLPIVVSMANVAASGGYWISTPADTIFADPSTITGSIGIFGVMPSVHDALARWGVTTDGVRTTALSGQPDFVGGISPEFDRISQSVIEKGYRDFLSRVAQSRGKTSEQIDAIGQGRVWAGGTARQLGLVDRFGDLDDALAEAARLAKLGKSDWHPLFLEPQIDFASGLLSGLVRAEEPAPMDLFARAAWEQRATLAQVGADLKMLTSVQGAQALCLECGALSGGPMMEGDTAKSWIAPWAYFLPQ